MQRQLRDPLFIFTLWMLAFVTCYWAGSKYSFAVNPPPNCANCPCKNCTAWQLGGDPANAAHGIQEQVPKSNPPRYVSVLAAQVNISTLPNSCNNNTGKTNQVNGNYANWYYVNAASTCSKPVLPQEMSPSDVGVWKANMKVALVCQ